MSMKVLFIGESWLGSCARSMREALSRHPGIEIEEINEDALVPKPRAPWLRALNRVLRPAYQKELYKQIISSVSSFNPDVVMTYKGHPINAGLVRELQSMGRVVVNVYPDCSPHAHGDEHKEAVGAYDLVISTKPFHPPIWKSVYGYDNACVFVPQGYDPALHLVENVPTAPRFDLVMVATWRPEYHNLMKALARLLADETISVGIGGSGWTGHQKDYPSEWVLLGPLHGRSYVKWLRQGRICLAPVTRDITIGGAKQPGDEDSTRTYELAAAHCFFIHRRTDYVRTVYDANSEVPMFETPEELAEKITYYLGHASARDQFAEAAHRRAVPAYLLDNRAKEVVNVLEGVLKTR
jgi:glycosyltransferase involved in cell wall biosynthesis